MSWWYLYWRQIITYRWYLFWYLVLFDLYIWLFCKSNQIIFEWTNNNEWLGAPLNRHAERTTRDQAIKRVRSLNVNAGNVFAYIADAAWCSMPDASDALELCGNVEEGAVMRLLALTTVIIQRITQGRRVGYLSRPTMFRLPKRPCNRCNIPMTSQLAYNKQTKCSSTSFQRPCNLT